MLSCSRYSLKHAENIQKAKGGPLNMQDPEFIEQNDSREKHNSFLREL